MKAFVFLTKEEKAMAWWNILPNVSFGNSYNKSTLTEKYFGNMRIHKSLKDAEIEMIYNKEKELYRQKPLK